MTFTVLGKDVSEENTITLPKADQRQGVYIIGKTGFGKSTLLENMVTEDIKNNVGVCVVDPNNDLIDNIISRLGFQVNELKILIDEEQDKKKKDKLKRRYNNLKRRLEEDVIFIDLASRDYVAPFSLFYCDNPDDSFDSENVVSAFMHIMSSMYDISDQHVRLNQYFINIARLLTYNPQNTLLDIKRVMTDDSFLEKLLVNVHDPDVIWFWKDFFQKYSKGTRRGDDISMVSNKLEEFTKPVMRPWFGDITSPVNFRAFMDQGKLVFIKLNAQWPSLNKLLGNIIIAQLLDAAYSRRDIRKDDRRQMNVYIDEVQDYASPDLGRLFTQSRKYGLALTMAHQVLEQLDPLVKATCRQAANIISFRLSGENAKDIASEYDCSPQPGPPRQEPLKTPVRNPIEFMGMYTKGVHPQEVIRNFMEKYGNKLLENARKEEALEGDSRREWQRYEHDLAAGSRYIAAPSITVTNDARRALELLNTLFFQAMLAGKAGENPDDISIPDDLSSLLMRVVGDIGSRYITIMEEYQERMKGEGIEVTDLDKRREELYMQTAGCYVMINEKANSLQEVEKEAKEKLREAYRKYIQAQVSPVRANIFIVERTFERRSKKLFAPKTYEVIFVIPHVRDDHPYNGRFVVEMYDGKPNFEIDFTRIPRKLSFEGAVSNRLYHNWEEAAWFYLHLYENAWFHIDQTTFLDRRNWKTSERCVIWEHKDQYHRQHMLYSLGDKDRYWGTKPEELEFMLPTWELLPGIENTWSTPALVEKELERYMENVEKGHYGMQDRYYDLAKNYLERSEHVPNPKFPESYKTTHIPDTSIVAITNQAEVVLSKARYDNPKALEEVKKDSEKKRARINEEISLTIKIQALKSSYDTFITTFTEEIREVMRVLAAAPIEADSGLTQEVPGPEIPSTEVERRIANQIASLPEFTARARLKTGEYTITTIDPAPEEEIEDANGKKRKKRKLAYLKYNDLRQCIEDIQQRNAAQGYLRLRSDVEKDILDRRQPPQANGVPKQPAPPKTPPAGTAVQPPVANKPDTEDDDTEPSLPVVRPPFQAPPPPTPRRRKLNP